MADLLSKLARTLEHEAGVDETLKRLVGAAVATVPGARHASITPVQRRSEVQTLAATGELPRAIDHAQYDNERAPARTASGTSRRFGSRI